MACAVALVIVVGEHLYRAAHRYPPEMIAFPAGDFAAGAPDTPLTLLIRKVPAANPETLIQAPPKEVEISADFLIDRTEVRNSEYARFLAAIGWRDPALLPDAWKDKGVAQPEHPVTGVTRASAAAYCRWAGKRLPSSIEWERAARGTKGRLYVYGARFDPTKANTREAGMGAPARVGANVGDRTEEGVLDLGGNVAEWVSDRKAPPSISGAPADTEYVRGASFDDAGEFYGLAFLERPATPGHKGPMVGFRCAADEGGKQHDGMILIRRGRFIAGSESSPVLNIARKLRVGGVALRRMLERPAEPVGLDAFAIDKFEVTDRDLAAYLRSAGGAGQSTVPANSTEPRAPNAPGERTSGAEAFGIPARNVTWHQAAAYCAAIGKRLPSAHEWERAARGGGRLFPYGDAFQQAACNTLEAPNTPNGPLPAGAMKNCVTPEGVYDMSGNVDEWTSTSRAEGSSGTGYVLKGGGWDEPGEFRGLPFVSVVMAPDQKRREVGFRCAASPGLSWIERTLGWRNGALPERR